MKGNIHAGLAARAKGNTERRQEYSGGIAKTFGTNVTLLTPGSKTLKII
jgi:hypothetical protein